MVILRVQQVTHGTIFPDLKSVQRFRLGPLGCLCSETPINLQILAFGEHDSNAASHRGRYLPATVCHQCLDLALPLIVNS